MPFTLSDKKRKMKCIKLLVLMIVASICFACNNQASTKESDVAAPKEVKVPEGPLAQKLYANYHADAKTVDQIDENRLIEYAVTNNIDVTKSPSGLYYQIKNVSDDPLYNRNSQVTAHYRGTTLDGKEFDSSYGRGEPMTFRPQQMIPAWQEALSMMNAGSSATLLVPSRLAYGSEGFPGYIEPNTPLVFTFECLN